MKFLPVFLVFVLLSPSCALSEAPEGCEIDAAAAQAASLELCRALSRAGKDSGLEEINVQVHQLDQGRLDATLAFTAPHGRVTERIAMHQWDKDIAGRDIGRLARGLIQAALRASQT